MRKKYLIAIFVAAFCALTALCVPSAFAQEAKDDFEIIIERKRISSVGGDYDVNDPSAQAVIKKREGQARQAWGSMIKTPDRTLLWDGLVLDKYTAGAGINSSFSNLNSMAVGWGMKGTSVYHNEELKKDILEGLEFLNKTIYYKEDRYTRTGQLNWFYWEISIPQSITNICCIMYDEMGDELRKSLVDACLNYAPHPAVGGLYTDSPVTGANLIWKCVNHILLGALSKNKDLIEEGKGDLKTTFEYVDEIEQEEGFKTDGSYIMHISIPYVGGYGKDSFAYVVTAFSLIDGTEYGYDEEISRRMYDMGLNTFLPAVYKCSCFDVVRGRYIAREGTTTIATGIHILQVLFQLSVNAPADVKMKLQRGIKQNLLASEELKNSFFSTLSIDLAPEAWKLMEDDSIPPADYIQGGKYYAGMECAYYRNKDFAFALKLFSKRTLTYEQINDENLKSWYISHGTTFIYNNDLKHYVNNYWATTDYYKLAGTTVTDTERPVGYMQGYKNTKEWVGGATLDEEFVAVGMDYEDYKTQQDETFLSGKKSWFMIDGQIIALGSGIKNGTPGVDNNTFIENRIVSKADKFYFDGKEYGYGETVSGNPKYIFYDGQNDDIGYVFLQNHNVEMKSLENSGRWKDVRSSDGSEKVHTNPFLHIKISHGEKPLNESYAYVLLPGKSMKELASYSENPSTIILENSPRAAAVKNDENCVTAVNFWQKEKYSVDGITVDTAACVVKQEKDGELHFAISDPTQRGKEIIVEFDNDVSEIIYLDDDIEVLQTSPTLKLKLNVFESLGYTMNGIVKLKNSNAPSVNPPYTMGEKKITAVRECVGKVYKNSIISQCDAPIYENGNLMASVSFLSKYLGGEITLEGDTVCVKDSNNTGSFSIGNGSYVNGNYVGISAKVIDGHYYIPLRIAAEKIYEKNVLYDEGVVILSDKTDEIDEAICEYFKIVLR